MMNTKGYPNEYYQLWWNANYYLFTLGYNFHRNRPIMTFIIIYYIFELIPKNKFTLKNW